MHRFSVLMQGFILACCISSILTVFPGCTTSSKKKERSEHTCTTHLSQTHKQTNTPSVTLQYVFHPVAEAVREPAFANRFYPAHPEQLTQELQTYLKDAIPRDISGTTRGLIVPHAGYMYSGAVAATGYKTIYKHPYKTVIVLGPSHHYPIDYVALTDQAYQSPFGPLPLSKLQDKLVEHPLFRINNAIHQPEHAIEVQIPFIQMVLGNVELIPLLIGDLDPTSCKQVATALAKIISDDTLILVSSDLSHYHDYVTSVQLDKKSIQSILAGRIEEAYHSEIDGAATEPVVTLMEIAHQLEWYSMLLDHKNSGDIQQTQDKVVGYASLAFTDTYPGMLEPVERDFIRQLVFKTIHVYVKEGKIYDPMEESLPIPKHAMNHQACFVTVEKHHHLRGCIGSFNATQPLYLAIRDHTIHAVSQDRRFEPVVSEELDAMSFHVSILSEQEPVPVQSWDEYKHKIIPFYHGVNLDFRGAYATFLPSVWLELHTHTRFFQRLCLKANADQDCWKEHDTLMQTYTAETIFGSLNDT